MPIGKKIRIYDLARDLKQDAKRVLEDLRREGADVSVPSNSVSMELAEKVRLKYFPKAEVAPKRAIKVIKATKKSGDEPETPETDEAALPDEVQAAEPETVEAPEIVEAEEPTAAPAKPATKSRGVIKLQKKAVPAPVEAVSAEPEAAEAQTVEASAAEEGVEVPAAERRRKLPSLPAGKTANRVLRPTGTQIKQLTLTRDAIEKGVKPGERFVSDAPTKTGKLNVTEPARDARGRRVEFRGTPGETAAPQMTYTPPADNRRRPGRSGGRKGRGDDKGGRFAE